MPSANLELVRSIYANWGTGGLQIGRVGELLKELDAGTWRSAPHRGAASS
jgi:hypothetical protein